MRSLALTGVFVTLLAARSVLTVAVYGQCGGTGYTGSTTCDSGLTCIYQNDYYSQCLASSTTTTAPTVKITTTTTATKTTTTSSSSGSSAIGSPIGFASGTTGGAGRPTVTPTTTAELLTYLADTTARTVVLTKVFDFTDYCIYQISDGLQTNDLPLNQTAPQQEQLANNMFVPTAPLPRCCSTLSREAVMESEIVLLSAALDYNSGQNKGLSVGSNKTILGKGSNAGVKGIGLWIRGVSNVIVQNIKITDLNPSMVWGGDGIAIGGSSKVWIDHCYFARMGRQFIVTGFDPNTAVTISNNYFDGQSSYSVTRALGMHYWAIIFDGKTDEITFIYNHIYYTSGRGPHAGGATGYTAYIHLANNYYDTIGGHAIDAGDGSIILTEGNYFESVTTPDTGIASGGLEYFVQTVADADSSPRDLSRLASRQAFFSSFSNYSVVKSFKPKGVADVPAYVLANAGVGIIN
ncbi:hypothetical protein FRB90_011435 [Tulasnella sp. 427]|nr:hypothetical protein FRB90_011435 [Tulasnella sp. 427]